MRVFALLSGGKDSTLAALIAAQSHALVGVGFLVSKVEADSHTFQSIGTSGMARNWAKVSSIPSVSAPLVHKSTVREGDYVAAAKRDDDEMHDLERLLRTALERIGPFDAIVAGALASNYQRDRFEAVAAGLGLLTLAPLWQWSAEKLLDELERRGVRAVFAKVASGGLPLRLLGKSITDERAALARAHARFGIHEGGEGGEYESFTLDAPTLLFDRGSFVLERTSHHVEFDDDVAPVGWLVIDTLAVKEKEHADNASVGIARDAAETDLVKPFCVPTKQSNDDKAPLASSEALVAAATLDTTTIPECTLVRVACDDPLVALSSAIAAAIVHGFSVEEVAFVDVHMRNLRHAYSAFNQSYVDFFLAARLAGHPWPARAVVDTEVNGSVALTLRKARRTAVHVQAMSQWAPASIGPYAQASVFDDGSCFLAGQIGLDPWTMTLHLGLLNQLRQATANVKAVVRIASPTSNERRVRVSAYVATDAIDVAGVQQAFDEDESREGEEGAQNRLVCVAVHRVAQLPKGALVELVAACAARE